MNRPDVRRVVRGGGEEKGGVPCPECGGRIAISLDDLLVRRAFTCATPACRTVLRLDNKGSGEALGALRQIKTRLRDIG